MSMRPPRTHSVVGVALDGDVLRGVQMALRPGGPQVGQVAEVDLDPAISDQGRIIHAAGLTDALRRLWDEGQFRTNNVAFGIDGRDAMFRRLTIPIAAGSDLETTVRYELADYLPYDLADAVTSIHEVSRDSETIEVVAVAVRIATTERILGIVSEAGLQLSELTLGSTALGGAVAHLDPGGSEAIVTVDGASTTILLRRGGRATVARVLSSGGGSRTAQVADEIADALATVDRFRTGSGPDTAGEAGQARRFRSAATEVAAAINFELSENSTGGAPTSVLLAGTYGDDPSLHACMAEEVDAPVSVIPTPPWWAIETPFAPYAAAAGLARSALMTGGTAFLRLDPPSAVFRRTRRREALAGIGTGLVVALAAIQFIAPARSAAEAADGAAIDAEAHADVVAAQLDSLDDLASLNLDVEEHRRLVDEAVAGELAWARLLEEIAVAIPDETFFTGISLRQPDPESLDEDTTASFTGVALDQEDVARWLLAVAEVPGVEDVWLVQSTASVFGDDEVPVVSFIAEADLALTLRSDRALHGVIPRANR